MSNIGNPQKKSLIDRMKELGQEYGVMVTDMSERDVRAVGLSPVPRMIKGLSKQSRRDPAGEDVSTKNPRSGT